MLRPEIRRLSWRAAVEGSAGPYPRTNPSCLPTAPHQRPPNEVHCAAYSCSYDSLPSLAAPRGTAGWGYLMPQLLLKYINVLDFSNVLYITFITYSRSILQLPQQRLSKGEVHSVMGFCLFSHSKFKKLKPMYSILFLITLEHIK